MSGDVQMGLRNEEFAAKLALTYAELYDGISPVKQRVSLRIKGDLLELKNVATQAVSNWSLAQMREVQDTSEEMSMTFAANDEDPARLVIYEVEALRALAMTGARFEPLRGPRGQVRNVAVMGVIAAACFGGLLFGLIPWFADRAAETIPVEAEARLGQEAFQLYYLAGGMSECLAPDGRAALDTMEARLTDGIDMPMPLHVRVVRDPSINATALPGGHITLHMGLIQNAESPEEVASVLAHEIGHVVNRDGTRAQIRAMGSYGLVGLLFGDALGIGAIAGGSAIASAVIDASYSREAEEIADVYAHEMMRNAGLPPEAMGDFFGRLLADMPEMEMGALRHLSTHPELRARIEAAEAAGAVSVSSGPPVLSDAEWASLQNICQGGGGDDSKG